MKRMILLIPLVAGLTVGCTHGQARQGEPVHTSSQSTGSTAAHDAARWSVTIRTSASQMCESHRPGT